MCVCLVCPDLSVSLDVPLLNMCCLSSSVYVCLSRAPVFSTGCCVVGRVAHRFGFLFCVLRFVSACSVSSVNVASVSMLFALHCTIGFL